jgi:hypothetical protein
VLFDYLFDQEMRAVRTFVLDHAVDRVQPFPRFLRVDIRFDIHAALLRRSFKRSREISIVCVAAWHRIAATRHPAARG